MAGREPKESAMPAVPLVGSRGVLCMAAPPCGPDGDVRLGLVLRVDPTAGVAEIAIVHPYVDLATATDGIVPSTASGTPYDVVVQTDLRGMVWTRQLSRPQGRIAEVTLAAVSDLVEHGQAAAGDIRLGAPLSGQQDRRWAFKVAEGQALDLLTGACTATLLADHGVLPWQRHPALRSGTHRR